MDGPSSFFYNYYIHSHVPFQLLLLLQLRPIPPTNPIPSQERTSIYRDESARYMGCGWTEEEEC